jgi:hypothetical protein
MRRPVRKGTVDESIANLMREFLRIVDKHKERVILSFIRRANERITVVRGTRTEFLELRQEYNDFVVGKAWDLIDTINSELKLKGKIEERERPVKITQDLDVSEPSPSPADIS